MPMRARLLQLRAGAARPSALLQPTAALSTAAAAPLERSSSIKVKDLQGRARPAGKRVTRLDGPFELDYGGSLPHVDVAWEQWGDPSLPASRTVYILPSFSNSSHVVRSLNDPSPGWWEGMVGPGLYIDTNRFRVLSASNLGGPFGTTSPISEDPTTGKPYRLNFPQITPGDVARVHHRLMQQVRGLARLIPELWAVSPLWKALPQRTRRMFIMFRIALRAFLPACVCACVRAARSGEGACCDRLQHGRDDWHCFSVAVS